MFSAQYSLRTTDYKAGTTDGCLGRISKSGFGGDLGLTVVLEMSMPVRRAAERMVRAATMALWWRRCELVPTLCGWALLREGEGEEMWDVVYAVFRFAKEGNDSMSQSTLCSIPTVWSYRKSRQLPGRLCCCCERSDRSCLLTAHILLTLNTSICPLCLDSCTASIPHSSPALFVTHCYMLLHWLETSYRAACLSGKPQLKFSIATNSISQKRD